MFTNLLTELMLGHLKGSYAALHFEDPAVAGEWASELSGGGYCRVNASMMPTGMGAAWNLNPIVFKGLPAGRISHVALWDRPSGGSMLTYAPLTPAVTMIEGGVFPIGAQEYAVSIGAWAGAEDTNELVQDVYDDTAQTLAKAALDALQTKLNADMAAKLKDATAALDASYKAQITSLQNSLNTATTNLNNANARIKTLEAQLASKTATTTSTAAPKGFLPVTDDIVNRVIRGEFGNAPDRYTRLTAAGYDWKAVQNAVNAKLGNPTRY